MGVVIELVRPPVSASSDAVAAALADLVVAFTVVEDPSLDGPVLREGTTVVRGDEEVAAFLDVLRNDVRLWNAFQSDACYIGDDGKIC